MLPALLNDSRTRKQRLPHRNRHPADVSLRSHCCIGGQQKTNNTLKHSGEAGIQVTMTWTFSLQGGSMNLQSKAFGPTFKHIPVPTSIFSGHVTPSPWRRQTGQIKSHKKRTVETV